jgi:pimeloyl-ACP methyl ester carboxylesterase
VAEAVSNGQLAIFEKSAHAPFYEEPEEFNRVLEAFLAEGRGREEDRA